MKLLRLAFLTVSLLVTGCTTPPLATEADEVALWTIEARLPDGNVAGLVPPGTPAETVRALLGPPDRSTFNTWEYSLAGFNRPRTLVVSFSPDDVVTDAHVFERRGALRHRRIAAR